MAKNNRHPRKVGSLQPPQTKPIGNVGERNQSSTPHTVNQVEVLGLDRVAQPLASLSAIVENQDRSNTDRKAEVAALSTEVKNMAESLQVVANHVKLASESDQSGSFIKRLFTWKSTIKLVVAITSIISIIWTLEIFLQHMQDTQQTQAESAFNAFPTQLASSQAAIQANAVRTIHKLAFFQTVTETSPNNYFPFVFVSNRLSKRFEYPLMQRCRTLFCEFATQDRTTNSLENNVVSSALLETGMTWQAQEQTLGNNMSIAQGSLLFKAKLPQAHAVQLVCDHMIFGAVDLSYASLSDCKFNDCGFMAANLSHSNLNGCEFNDAVFTGANLQSADLSFAQCENAFFCKTDFSGSTFKQTNLSGANFTSAILDKAVFNQAMLTKVVFKGASLKGALFSQVDVANADFQGADIEGADFTKAFGVTKVNWNSTINSDKARITLPTQNSK